MAFWDRFRRPQRRRDIRQFFELFPMYTPAFSTFDGGLYEMMLVRAAIHTFATHVSKLKPQLEGDNDPQFERLLQFQPNPLQDTTTFLYQLATIFAVQNNAFIIPLYDNVTGEVNGYFPLLPTSCRIIEENGIHYLEYRTTYNGQDKIELGKVGILSQMTYLDPLFGENNRVLDPYMQVMMTQNEGIIEGIKNAASIRFFGKLNGLVKPEDIAEARQNFREDNLGTDNDNGIAVFDNRFDDVKQIDSKAMIVNPAQAKEIRENVYSYFGVSDEIIQNKYTNSAIWTAYYEGRIEPFAIKLSLVMSNMTFGLDEIIEGTSIVWTANRLQYATNEEKINIVSTLFDRGMLNQDDGREVFNMSPLPDGLGNEYYVRLDYAKVKKLKIDEEGNINATQTSNAGISSDDPAIDSNAG
jgi:Phage portal protein.